ncbi:MAG: 50S ribosomal protein L29 [Candidatus Omnitrophica bacterium]|nr:50S ribosomal protein L29 [Candidatus Omnitrophota bacterium]
MKVEEIKNLSVDEIDAKVLDLKKMLLDLRIQAKNKKLEQVSKLGLVKKDIARLLTVRRQKEKELLAEGGSAQPEKVK